MNRLRNYSDKITADTNGLGQWHRPALEAFKWRDKRVTDIGTGAGVFLEAVREMGADVFGIEPNPVNCAMLATKGIPHHHGYADQLEDCASDIVTCFEVIEHVYSPHQIVSDARRFLSERRGTFVVSTPNAFNIARAIKFALHQRHHDPLLDPVKHGLDAEHVRLYSFVMVRELLAGHGFSNIRVIGCFPLQRYFAHQIIMAADAR